MKKIIITLLSFLLFLSPALHHAVSYNLSDFESSGLKVGVGFVQVDSKPYAKTSLHPNFGLGPLDIGLDLNLYMPVNKEDSLASELNSVALRYIAYDHNGVAGLKWGRLSNVSLGYGLLMNNYDSGMSGSTEFNSEKAGFLGYGTVKQLRVDGMYTGTNVKAARVAYTIPYYSLWDTSFIVGGTFVEDSDGIDDTYNGETVTRKDAQGYALDLALPIGGELFTIYTEYANIETHGSGYTLGFRGDFFQRISYKLGYIRYEKDFIPHYFNQAYEVTSTPQGLSEGQNGYVAGASVGFMNNLVKAGAEYEKIGSKNLGTVSLGWSQFRNTIGVINYIIPFNGSRYAVAKADIVYLTGGAMDVVYHIKRVYYDDEPVDSYSVSTRWNLGKLFPGASLFQ